MDSIPLSLDAWATSLPAAIANTLASSTAMATHLNDELTRLYLSRFNDWTISVIAGKIDNSNPPKPPTGYVLITDPIGFSWPSLTGTEPLCDMPPIPADYSKPQVLVIPEPEHIRNVPRGDTMPVGYVAIDAAGNRWQKQASPTPFGVAYFYARVA
jgi:hypothetical protein